MVSRTIIGLNTAYMMGNRVSLVSAGARRTGSRRHSHGALAQERTDGTRST